MKLKQPTIKYDCEIIAKFQTGLWIFKQNWITLSNDDFTTTFNAPVRSNYDFNDMQVGETIRVSFKRNNNGNLVPIIR